MLVLLLLSLNGCLTLDDTLDPDGDGVFWPDDCDNTDPTVFDAERTKSYLDNDGDGHGDRLNSIYGCPTEGYVLKDDDCNDSNAMINPNMPELCDGVDQDCDEKIDDDDDDSKIVGRSVEKLYADSDGDTFGDPNSSEMFCTNRVGPYWVKDSTDCDDTNASVNPNATEECDENDNDCDGEIDEDTIDKKLRYNDSDSDGYGNPDSPTRVCPGYEEGTTTKFLATDCNDDNPNIYPDANETCDGFDNNCDNIIDVDAIDRNQYFSDSDRDSFGNADSIVYSCSPVPSLRMSDNPDDCDDSDGSTFPNAGETCGDSIVNDCNARLKEVDGGVISARTECPVGSESLANAKIKFIGNAGEGAGTSIAGMGDFNGDGLSDLLIGAPWYGDYVGGAYLVYGSKTLRGQVSLSNSDHFILGESPMSFAGSDVNFVQDIDADGRSEVLISVPMRVEDEEVASGSAYLIMSSTAPKKKGFSKRELNLSVRGVEFSGSEEPFEWFDNSVLLLSAFEHISSRDDAVDVGDVDQDGHTDLLMATATGEGRGVYLVYGSSDFTGTYILSSNYLRISLITGGNSALSTAGDIDGDGCSEFLIGDSSGGDNYEGGVYLFRGCQAYSGDVQDADSFLRGEAIGGWLGVSIQGGVDINGDAYPDLLVGAPADDTIESYAYIVHGDSAISSAIYDLGRSEATIYGTNTLNGRRVAFGGDLNGDDVPEVIIGDYSDSNKTNGAAYIFVSPSSLSGNIDVYDADIILTEEVFGDWAGYSISGIGDFDGDGLDDLAIGAPDENSGGSEAGAVYLISGASLFDY